MTRPTCIRCSGQLYGCDRLTGSEVCVECVRKSLAPSEWAIFRAALASSIRPDGLVGVNDVRPKVRGRIAPKHIGTYWRRAVAEGLVEHTGQWEQSTDTAGRNADKQARLYRAVTTQERAA